ncbi:MAG: hypothetical protein BroJett015_19510 [Chloroflexota bacterium]|nr:hypothetical protein [Ardenticatenaceae bacterium]GIK56288.1 MAG: hypothetical protein BroJett015_19510 [Chloroflexota bacterium]
MLWLYLLAFCRITIGLLFAASFGGKVRDRKGFAQTISRFGLLPQRWSYPLALLFLGAELLVVILIIWGGPLLAPAFGLAFLLLVIFTVALASVLIRNISTTCHCFGRSEKQVTYADVWRNIGFIGCSLLGWWLAPQIPEGPASQNWLALIWGGLGGIAATRDKQTAWK